MNRVVLKLRISSVLVFISTALGVTSVAQSQTIDQGEMNGNNNVILNTSLDSLLNSPDYRRTFGISNTMEDDFALFFPAGGSAPVSPIIPKEAPDRTATTTPGGRLFTPDILTRGRCNVLLNRSGHPHGSQRTLRQLGLTSQDVAGQGDVSNSSGTLVFEDNIQDNRLTVISPSNSTTEIQESLDCASRENNGGIVYFSEGNYMINELFLRSNLRVVVDPEATFFLPETSRHLFNIGRNIIRSQDWLTTDPTTGRQVENVEIAVLGGGDNRFTVNLKGSCELMIDDPETASNQLVNVPDRDFNRTAIPFIVGFAENFSISGARVIDNYTISPSVFLVTDTDGQIGNRLYEGEFYLNPYQNRAPNKGSIQNIDASGISTNYAVLQLFAGENIFVNNLSADDGITVRLEPGRSEDPLNQAGPFFGAIRHVELNNLRIEDGFTALFVQPHAKIFEDILVRDIVAIDSATAVFTESSELPIHYLEPNDESDGEPNAQGIPRTYPQLASRQTEEDIRSFELPNRSFPHQGILHRNAEFFYKRGKVDGPGIVLNGRIRFTETAQNQAKESDFFAQVATAEASRDLARDNFMNGNDVCVLDTAAGQNEFNFPDITPASRIFLTKNWLDEVANRQNATTERLRNDGVLTGNRRSAAADELPYDFGRRRRSIPEPIAPILAAGTFSADQMIDNIVDENGAPLDHSTIADGRYGLTFGSRFRIVVPRTSRERITTYANSDEVARLSGEGNGTLYRNTARNFGGVRSAEPAVPRIYDHLTDEGIEGAVRSAVRANPDVLSGTIELEGQD
ncbi:hypothetical protein EYS14_24455 [Alteromonadaceae bacterium M269]|nr:hypothetical protein EYS14_24455 [Alteromonadaceae bacterium M269]